MSTYALIGFEESQAVTISMREFGVNAFSCDIKETSGIFPEFHIKSDIYRAIKSRKWDFIGLHPPCTAMTLAGNRTCGVGKPRHQDRLDAVEWTVRLWEYATSTCDRVYMENPIGAMQKHPKLPKPYIVQPYYFGDEAQKSTCLWLHGLPPLLHSADDNLFESKTHVDKGEFYYWTDPKTGKTKRQPLWYAQAKGFGGKQKNGDYSETRSKTFYGIAKAMAEQWSHLI